MDALAPWITLALLVALFAWLKNDIRALEARIDERMDGLHAQIGGLRERMARLEGVLDGFIAGRRTATRSERGCPARAGMASGDVQRGPDGHGMPHTRGDGPHFGRIFNQGRDASHARGRGWPGATARPIPGGGRIPRTRADGFRAHRRVTSRTPDAPRSLTGPTPVTHPDGRAATIDFGAVNPDAPALTVAGAGTLIDAIKTSPRKRRKRKPRKTSGTSAARR